MRRHAHICTLKRFNRVLQLCLPLKETSATSTLSQTIKLISKRIGDYNLFPFIFGTPLVRIGVCVRASVGACVRACVGICLYDRLCEYGRISTGNTSFTNQAESMMQSSTDVTLSHHCALYRVLNKSPLRWRHHARLFRFHQSRFAGGATGRLRHRVWVYHRRP